MPFSRLKGNKKHGSDWGKIVCVTHRLKGGDEKDKSPLRTLNDPI